jgi:hypothetical protein
VARDEMIPADTTVEAHRLQGRLYREMTGTARVAIAFDLSDMVRRVTEAGIRRRHPHYTDEEVFLARARVTLGDALTRAAWPDRPLVDP